MKNFNYRVVVSKNGSSAKVAADNCHEAKSLGGHLFHSKGVKSVTVADITGKVFLYLNKERPEASVNVPSELAML
jgi:hypothetical protein